MKTHELARALRVMAEVLDRAPNQYLDTINLALGSSDNISMPQMAVNLATLTDMSRIGKTQWIEFVREYKLPIDFRARDAARDILGKVLNYLESNADARKALKEKVTKRQENTSPELMRAFAFLLKDQPNE